MQVAIASSDKKTVDLHFGQAVRFLIYEIEGENKRLVMTRTFQPLSSGDKNHAFDPARFAAVAENLVGCERVYCTRIGERPAEELGKLGIVPIIFQGAITDIVL